jgi:DNA-binding GntR family transcriptional regulator
MVADVGGRVIDLSCRTGEITHMTPTYREIADDLAARISAGELKPGDRMPTTDEVAAEFGVSEATAYRGLSLLVDRGLVRGEQGRARYVIGTPPTAHADVTE